MQNLLVVYYEKILLFSTTVLRGDYRDSAQVFLLAKGVECEAIDTDKFKVTEQMQSFIGAGGKIFACGTCLKIRHSEGSDMCPNSTMGDLYEIVQESDKVLTF